MPVHLNTRTIKLKNYDFTCRHTVNCHHFRSLLDLEITLATNSRKDEGTRNELLKPYYNFMSIQKDITCIISLSVSSGNIK